MGPWILSSVACTFCRRTNLTLKVPHSATFTDLYFLLQDTSGVAARHRVGEYTANQCSVVILVAHLIEGYKQVGYVVSMNPVI